MNEQKCKIVDFTKCKSCMFYNLTSDKHPCNKCLFVPAREESRTPIFYKKKEN